MDIEELAVPVGLVALGVTVAALLYAIVWAFIALHRWRHRTLFEDIDYGVHRTEGPITQPIPIVIELVAIPANPPSALAETKGLRARVARPRQVVLRSTTR